MRWFRDERGAATSAQAAGAAAVSAALLAWMLAVAPERISAPVIETVEEKITSAQGGAADPQAATGVAEDTTLTPLDAGTDATPGLIDYLPTAQIGTAAGQVIAGGVPADQAALALVGPITNAVANYAVDQAGIPAPLDQGLTQAATTAVVGAALGQLDGGAVVDAALGGIADSVVTNTLGDIGVGGTVANAAGNFINGLLQGGEAGDLALKAGVDIAASNILQVFGDAAPIIGPFLSLWTSALTGGALPGPGSVIGSVLGGVFGGPLGALGGGLVGGLLDGLLGFGKPASFDITDKVDVSGDGVPDQIEGLTSDTDYRYTVTSGIEKLPIREANIWLEERQVPTGEYADDSIVTESRYTVKGGFIFEPLTPSTDAPMVRLDTTNALREKASPALVAENTPEENGFDDDPDSSLPGRRGTVLGYEVTEAEFRALEAALGGDRVQIGATDPRMALVRPYAGLIEGVQFRQETSTEGLYFRYDINGDGAPDLFRTFPQIEGFVDGDGATRLVSLGVPG